MNLLHATTKATNVLDTEVIMEIENATSLSIKFLKEIHKRVKEDERVKGVKEDDLPQ